MKHLQLQQGTPEWLAARRGIPTASQFDRIMSPFTLKPLGGSTTYLLELLTEWVTGANLDDDVTALMQRGQAEEQDAIAFYELERGVETVRPGFILRDDGLVGCSPDLLVGEDGLVEMKVPLAKTHIGYLLEESPTRYQCQMQGQLWISGRKWIDFLSYNAKMPPVLLHFERDEAFIRELAAHVDNFVKRIDEAKATLLRKGVVPVDYGTPLQLEAQISAAAVAGENLD